MQVKKYSLECVQREPIFEFTVVCNFWEILLEKSRRNEVKTSKYGLRNINKK